VTPQPLFRPGFWWKLACYILAAALLHWVISRNAEERLERYEQTVSGLRIP
jgi:hypothetical protein